MKLLSWPYQKVGKDSQEVLILYYFWEKHGMISATGGSCVEQDY